VPHDYSNLKKAGGIRSATHCCILSAEKRCKEMTAAANTILFQDRRLLQCCSVYQ
jgi:hypothetical protein